MYQWAQATELGDFVQEAAKDRKFVIAIKEHESQEPKLLKIRVPSFEERTQFLRQRLVEVTKEMQSLLDIKSECDVRIHRVWHSIMADALYFRLS